MCFWRFDLDLVVRVAWRLVKGTSACLFLIFWFSSYRLLFLLSWNPMASAVGAVVRKSLDRSAEIHFSHVL